MDTFCPLGIVASLLCTWSLYTSAHAAPIEGPINETILDDTSEPI